MLRDQSPPPAPFNVSRYSDSFDEEESVRSVPQHDEDDEEVDAHDEDNHETTVQDSSANPHGKQTTKQVLYLAFTSLGAIYGDIGTSPLYVLNTIPYPNSPPSKQDIYGGMSIIFYLFTIIVIIKYVMIILVLGPNNGEGGQVAIYAKIARHLRIGPKGVTIPGGPEKDDMLLLTRQETSSSFLSMNKKMSDWKNSPIVIKIVSKVILVCCFLGCALVFSDGLLTPTTSVLSAIAGIQVAKPSFNSVLGVSEAVLVILFLLQQFGSDKISLGFAPIIFVWLIGLFIIGVWNIVKHHPGIFQALSPYYAIELLKHGNIDVIGGAMLSITGAEAMFADIGHFGKTPVQLALSLFVYPCLMIAYLGQAAYSVEHPEDIANVFYLSIPGGTNGAPYWIMFVLAILATIIASQALILGVFSIISQLINLDCFPNFKIIHVDKTYAGKVYIPTINWLLMIGVCGTTAGFKNSNNVTAAYGLGISLDFFVSSILIMICMVYVYEWSFWIPLAYGLIFLPLEGVMIVSNLKKVPHGAWFPILMAGLSFIFFVFWRWARSKKVDQEYRTRVRVQDLFPTFKRIPNYDTVDLRKREGQEVESEKVPLSVSSDGEDIVDNNLISRNVQTVASHGEVTGGGFEVNSFFGKHQLKRYDGVAIMYGDANHTVNSPNTVPYLYKLMIESFSSIPSVFIFCAVRVLSIPLVPEEERILVANMKIPGHYRCVVRFGFTEEVKVDQELLDRILNSFSQSTALIKKFNQNVGGDIANVPILHVFENELIRSHRYVGDEYQTKNWFVKSKRYFRKFLINYCFSPINNSFKSKGELVKIDEELIDNQRKLFIGSVVRL